MRNPEVAEASARRRSRTGKRQEVHGAARLRSVQILARTDRSMPSSNRGRRATDGRRSALQWGVEEGMKGVVMVGGFCVVVRITAPVAALFHHGARLHFLAGSCAGGLVAGIYTKKPSNHQIQELVESVTWQPAEGCGQGPPGSPIRDRAAGGCQVP